MSEQTRTKKTANKSKKSQEKSFSDLYHTISIIMDSKIKIQPDSVKVALVKEICKAIEMLDSEVQIGRYIVTGKHSGEGTRQIDTVTLGEGVPR